MGPQTTSGKLFPELKVNAAGALQTPLTSNEVEKVSKGLGAPEATWKIKLQPSGTNQQRLRQNFRDGKLDVQPTA